jgi:rhodanese-related sulfurtransferase
MVYQEISVLELKERLSQNLTGVQLVDVREPDELEESQLEGFLNLPLSQYQVWSAQLEKLLDAQRETLVLCHHGIRSADMCSFLMSRGFVDVKNIRGGIHAYALYADPKVPQY